MQKVFFRNLVAVVIAVVMLAKDHQPVSLSGPAKVSLFFRALLGTIGVICNFYAVDHLVLADATMLNKVGPFFAILFSYFLLKETIASYQIAALVATFCGCLLIIKPTGAGGELFPMLVALLGGISARRRFHHAAVTGQVRREKVADRLCILALLSADGGAVPDL